MPEWTIYADELQEGVWFKALDPRFAAAVEEDITGAIERNPNLEPALLYDRPDIILGDTDGMPVLVVERTIEVPSGHNVGQRFARLAAAAEARIPVVYFGPYVAQKHGGETAGPRFMNLRLFTALDHLANVNQSAVTSIKWPVDEHFEIVRQARKDDRMRAYLTLFLEAYGDQNQTDINDAIMKSEFENQQLDERNRFVATVRRAHVYEAPPVSVVVCTGAQAAQSTNASILATYDQVVLYRVGMRNVRADPYTGMAMLYRYLYVLGVDTKRALVLHFPHITVAMWQRAAKSGRRKDVRLFRIAADGIVFGDGAFLRRDEL